MSSSFPPPMSFQAAWHDILFQRIVPERSNDIIDIACYPGDYLDAHVLNRSKHTAVDRPTDENSDVVPVEQLHQVRQVMIDDRHNLFRFGIDGWQIHHHQLIGCFQ